MRAAQVRTSAGAARNPAACATSGARAGAATGGTASPDEGPGRRAMPRRGAAASYSATFSGQSAFRSANVAALRRMISLRFWSLRCLVVPRWGLVRGSPACRVLGLEAQHQGHRMVAGGRVGYVGRFVPADPGGRVGYVGRFVLRPSRGRRPCCSAVAVRRVEHQEYLEEPHAGLKQLCARVRGGRRGRERAATRHVRGPGKVLEAGIGGVSVSAELRQGESPLGCCEAPLKDVIMVLCLIAHRRDAGGALPVAGCG